VGVIEVSASARAVRRAEATELHELHERLLARRGEIADAISTRVKALADPSGIDNPAYAQGLRIAVETAIDYGLESIGSRNARELPIPSQLVGQARLAARSGVGLDTVLRRYFAGYTLLADFLIDETEKGRLMGGPALQRFLRAQAALFDRLLVAVSEAHGQADEPNLADRRLAIVERLLEGELVDDAELGYATEDWHLAVVVTGEGSVEGLRRLSSSLDRRLLWVRTMAGPIWAWLGSRTALEADELIARLASDWPDEGTLALGEPAKGVVGWRRSHRQAKAAATLMGGGADGVVRYADVALKIAVQQDELLVTSLAEVYLSPLAAERDGGAVARETLRAYFSAGRNVSSAAAALGVSRQTVRNRLKSIEDRLGHPIDRYATEIEMAVELGAADLR
jgi:hypothetical protein